MPIPDLQIFSSEMVSSPRAIVGLIAIDRRVNPTNLDILLQKVHFKIKNAIFKIYTEGVYYIRIKGTRLTDCDY